VLDKLLLRATRPYVGVPPEVARAWQLLIRTGGAMPASALADEVGWSGRHLADRFRRETGLTPKAAARVVRFDRARRLLAAGTGRSELPRLADVAAECAGCAPSRWRTCGHRIKNPCSRSRRREGCPEAPDTPCHLAVQALRGGCGI
jgi:transcriptional regulator GlxA family with amidase domain